MDKILKLIFKLWKTPKKNWQDDLEKINIYEDVNDIYAAHDTYHANCTLAFIVFAYHKDSTWLELHKDRLDNKIKIMKSVAGEWAMSDAVFQEVVNAKDKPANNVINWIFDYQKDWRWTQIELDFFYHSQIRELTKTISNDEDAKRALDKGKCIEEAVKRRRQGEALLKEISQEYMNLDTIATQENKKMPTQEIKGMMTWEEHKKRKKTSE